MKNRGRYSTRQKEGIRIGQTPVYRALERLADCCTADLAPCGSLCFMDGAASLEQDKWVDVEGTYHYDKNKGMEITVNGMEDAEPAEEEYVYSFSY